MKNAQRILRAGRRRVGGWLHITSLQADMPGTKRRNRYRHDEYKESHRPYIHGQEGEGEAKEGFLKKEGEDVCVTQIMCHIDPPDACCYQVGSSVIQVE